MFIDVHVLQTVPYSNLNRDDTGTPKTLVYGGAARARVSSQSWKRAARLYIERLMTDAVTYRTRNPHLRLGALLEAAGIASPEADIAARWVFHQLGTATRDEKDNVILFVAEAELAALRDAYVANRAAMWPDAEAWATPVEGAAKKKAKESKKSDKSPHESVLKDCLLLPRPTSIALFGRMLAADPKINVDAAVQVAHAFSTHPVEVELDYFTAAEDLPTTDDLTGGAHLGNAEFLTATFYRYATIDVRELIANIGGDTAVAAELTRLFLAAFCLSLPSGKNNVTAPHSVPDLVATAVRDSRPVSYAAAYERPIKGRDGHVGASIERLGCHAAHVARMLPADPLYRGCVATAQSPASLGEAVDGLAALIDASVAAGFNAA